MYHHSLLFVIVSKEDHIEHILKKIAPLEDCDYTFRTVSDIGEAADRMNRPDVAVICDSLSVSEGFEELNHETCALVAESESCLLADAGLLSKMCAVWIMPGSGGYDDDLLQMYFGHLASRMKRSADARKEHICFETLIDSVPDIAWFKDENGAHLIVNDSFCDMVEKEKEQIYKKGHCYIWNASKEDEEVCLRSDQIIMDSRSTQIFEENIKTKGDTRKLQSFKSALIDVDGTIFGTCGIAHDVTEMQAISLELDAILNSVPFAVLVEDTNEIVQKKNEQFDKWFPDFSDILGKTSEEWRKSLSKKMILDDVLKEVVMVRSEGEQYVLIVDEDLIWDEEKRVTGKIVTLTDITVERNLAKKNEYIANTDYLTGLHNRRSVMAHLEQIDIEDEVALMLIDLDNFKQVNDNYGHKEGDRALVETANVLKKCFRYEFVARMGGDEFMVVASGRTEEELKESAERLRSMLREIYDQNEEFKNITASVGIVLSSEMSPQQRNVQDMLHAADDLMYLAKNNGKNRYCFYGEKE